MSTPDPMSVEQTVEMSAEEQEAWCERFETDVKRAVAAGECDLEPCRSKHVGWTR